MAKAPSLRKDWTRGSRRTRQAVHGACSVEPMKREGTLRVTRGEEIEGAEPYEVKASSTVLNGGCDMKSSQSLLCTTFGYDTTRCPISGILRRCAGR